MSKFDSTKSPPKAGYPSPVPPTHSPTPIPSDINLPPPAPTSSSTASHGYEELSQFQHYSDNPPTNSSTSAASENNMHGYPPTTKTSSQDYESPVYIRASHFNTTENVDALPPPESPGLVEVKMSTKPNKGVKKSSSVDNLKQEINLVRK